MACLSLDGPILVQSFIFIVVEKVLSAFRIEKPVHDGRVIEPNGTHTPGIFPCVLSLLEKIRHLIELVILRGTRKVRVYNQAAFKGSRSLVRATATM